MHVAVVGVRDGTDRATRRRLGALPLAARYLVMSPASGIQQAGTGEGSFMAVKLHKPSVLVFLIESIQIGAIDC